MVLRLPNPPYAEARALLKHKEVHYAAHIESVAATLVLSAWSAPRRAEKKIGLSVIDVGKTSTPAARAYADSPGKALPPR